MSYVESCAHGTANIYRLDLFFMHHRGRDKKNNVTFQDCTACGGSRASRQIITDPNYDLYESMLLTKTFSKKVTNGADVTELYVYSKLMDLY